MMEKWVPCNKAGSNYTEAVPHAPCLLATTAPLDRLNLDDDSNGSTYTPRELWSRDAGAFFCNEVYYRTLSEVRSRRLRPASAMEGDAAFLKHRLLPVLFVHLPPEDRAPLAASTAIVRHIVSLILART